MATTMPAVDPVINDHLTRVQLRLLREVSHYIINPFPAELNNLNFHPLEVVARYRDPQLQVGGNYSCSVNLRPIICKYRCLNTNLIINDSDLIG